MRYSVALVLLTLVGCGESSEPIQGRRTSWIPMASTAPLPPTSSETYEPLFREIGTWISGTNHTNAADVTVAANGVDIEFTADAGDTVVRTSLRRIEDINVCYRPSDGRLVLGVVGRIEVGGVAHGRAQFYVDSNADGVIEAGDLVATVEDAAVPSNGARWVSIAMDPSGGAYVLDLRNFPVLALVDGNGDGVPDTVRSEAYFDSTQSHEIKRTRALVYDSSIGCLNLHEHSLHLPVASTFMRVRDTGGDGRADEYQLVPGTLE